MTYAATQALRRLDAILDAIEEFREAHGVTELLTSDEGARLLIAKRRAYDEWIALKD
jgi:hypothetical protein